MLTVAALLGFVACFAVWVNRQALNTDNWTGTSSEILADPHVQQALSVYLVNELFASETVQARLRSALPEQLQGLSAPLAAGVRELAGRAVPRLLAAPQVQELWRRANRAAHESLMRVLNGGSGALSTEKGVVALDIHQLVTELAAQLGLSGQLAAARAKLSGGAGAAARGAAEQRLGVTLPAGGGRIVIMRSTQLRAAQDIAKAIRGLAIVLPLLSLGLFALAVWLAGGWRRLVLRSTGWCLAGIGLAVLLVRRVAGDAMVKSLVANPANRPAGEAVWSIGTSLLYDIAVAMVAYGLVVVAAAWMAGTTRPAVWLRRAVAPWLREHPVGSYAVAAVALMLVVLWGPTPAMRQLLPVVGFAALAALGVAALRRQTAAEFPDAVAGEAIVRLRHSWPFAPRHAGVPRADGAHRGDDAGRGEEAGGGEDTLQGDGAHRGDATGRTEDAGQGDGANRGKDAKDPRPGDGAHRREANAGDRRRGKAGRP